MSFSSPLSEGIENAGLVMVTHGDDEGKTELLCIGIIEFGEGLPFVIGECIEAGTCLLGGGLLRKPSCCSQLAGEIRVGLEHTEAAVFVCGAKTPGQCIVEAGGAVMGGAQLEVVGFFGNPRRVLENATERLDEGLSVHRRRTLPWCGRMMFVPMSGDVDPACKPDAIVAFRVVDETAKCLNAARPADQPAVEPNRHHLRSTRLAFGIERIETVFQVRKN